MLQYFSQVQNGSALSHCMQTTGPRAMNASKKTLPERAATEQGEAPSECSAVDYARAHQFRSWVRTSKEDPSSDNEHAQSALVAKKDLFE
jgi:hypothetical protein